MLLTDRQPVDNLGIDRLILIRFLFNNHPIVGVWYLMHKNHETTMVHMVHLIRTYYIITHDFFENEFVKLQNISPNILN